MTKMTFSFSPVSSPLSSHSHCTHIIPGIQQNQNILKGFFSNFLNYLNFSNSIMLFKRGCQCMSLCKILAVVCNYLKCEALCRLLIQQSRIFNKGQEYRFLKTGFVLKTSIVKLAYMLIKDMQLGCSAKPQYFQATFILKYTTKNGLYSLLLNQILSHTISF